jgi:hypothetical protein
VDPERLSRTSQAVALTRAGMSRPRTEQGDPDAQRRLATHPSGLDSAQVAEELNAGRRHGGTEPWLTVLPAAAWRRLLGEAGWLVGREADPRAGSGGEGRSLLVVARSIA